MDEQVRAAGRTEEGRAERFLTREVQWARRAFPRANVAWWDANVSGRARDYRRLEAAERAMNRHFARPAPYEHVRRLLESASLAPLTRRRLERVRNAYQGMQASRDLLDRITAESTAVAQLYSTFRGELDGRPRSDNELEDILRTTTDSARARAAWEARKQIGSVVADRLRSLAELRNEAARAVGFPDFWHEQLILDEMDPERLVATLYEADRVTAAPFHAMKADLDRLLSERFKVAAAELRPWHYANPFFQEVPDVFAPSADPLFADKPVVELAARTYRDLGFREIDVILARSDLYPRPRKNQHAYALDVDREGDVRAFLNVEPNARWMSTLLHELGHTVYQDGVDRRTLPFDLRDDPQGFLNEGFAMFCEGPLFDPAWLAGAAGVPSDEAAGLAPRLKRQDTANLLAFIRWCLVIIHFERAFYADPSQDLDTLWWDLVERYQAVPRPERRRAPDWATKTHVATSPVYYQKYLYGQLFAAQLREVVDGRFGGWAAHPDAGAYVREKLFAPGATFPWPDLVQRVTSRPLGVEALGRAVQWSARRS